MSSFVTSDGIKIKYQEKGEGKPIILIHGWTADHTVFSVPVDYLSGRFRVITYDLRGHGASDRPETGLTLNRFARDLEELIDHLDLKKVTVAGWSMGSSILFEYVKTFGTKKLDKTAIIDMTPKLINDEEWKLGLNHGSFTVEDSWNALTIMCNNWMDFAEDFAANALPYMNKEQLAPLLEGLALNTPHVMYAMWIAMTVGDYRDVLKDIDVPTYIIYGMKSTLYSKETAEYIQGKLPQGKIVPFEGCTHFLPVEKPEELARTIEELASLA